MQPFMTYYRRGNSEALTDRMTDLKRVEMTFVGMAIPMQTRWFYMQFLAEAID